MAVSDEQGIGPDVAVVNHNVTRTHLSDFPPTVSSITGKNKEELGYGAVAEIRIL